MWFVARQGSPGRAFHGCDFVYDTLGCGTGDQRFLYGIIPAKLNGLLVEPCLRPVLPASMNDAGVSGR